MKGAGRNRGRTGKLFCSAQPYEGRVLCFWKYVLSSRHVRKKRYGLLGKEFWATVSLESFLQRI